jgi:hypothetical protein
MRTPSESSTSSESEPSSLESERTGPVAARKIRPLSLYGAWWTRATRNVILSYVFVILVHYVGANMYSRFCTAKTVQGLLLSPFLVPAPHCEGLRWVINHGALRINGMWFMVGSQVVDIVAHIFVK